ncbi:MAG: hypothetical protein HQL43_00650 [Alphaproteobacteria bacterium]|nr:hypothetical protein [Alphaproteobacteria bacterium]
MTPPRIAVAICLHHKPWLAMASLLSLLTQERQDFDLFLLFNEGDGSCPNKESYSEYNALLNAESASNLIAQSPLIEKSSYAEYDRVARRAGINPKLSPFDERLNEICRLNRTGVFLQHYENDQALDSGVWLKFIRSRAWENYDYVFTFQEGTLLTSPASLSTAIDMAVKHNIHFLASAHMKGRLPKRYYSAPGSLGYLPQNVTPLDHFHDKMAQRMLNVLGRDPDLQAAFDLWSEDVVPSRQYHVRDYETQAWYCLLATLLNDRPLTGSRNIRRLKKALRFLFPQGRRFSLEALTARLAVPLHDAFGLNFGLKRSPEKEKIFVDGTRLEVSRIVEPIQAGDVLFHCSAQPGWHAAGCNHMFSCHLLERFCRRFEQYKLFEVLDIPFAGSTLEVFWAYVPFWLGEEMWFWDGFHRVTKDTWTMKREDSPEGVALHLNRYALGYMAVEPKGELLVIKALSKDLKYLENVLPSAYFSKDNA